MSAPLQRSPNVEFSIVRTLEIMSDKLDAVQNHQNQIDMKLVGIDDKINLILQRVKDADNFNTESQARFAQQSTFRALDRAPQEKSQIRAYNQIIHS